MDPGGGAEHVNSEDSEAFSGADLDEGSKALRVFSRNAALSFDPLSLQALGVKHWQTYMRTHYP